MDEIQLIHEAQTRVMALRKFTNDLKSKKKAQLFTSFIDDLIGKESGNWPGLLGDIEGIMYEKRHNQKDNK